MVTWSPSSSTVTLVPAGARPTEPTVGPLSPRAPGESDVAVGEDGEAFDLGVASDGELAWPAEGGCVVPGLLWGLVPGALPTAGVVPGLIVVTHRLQLGQVGRRHRLGTEPGFEGAVVALNLAAGLRVIRAGVDQPSAGGGDNTGEAGGSGAAGSAGERPAVF